MTQIYELITLLIMLLQDTLQNLSCLRRNQIKNAQYIDKYMAIFISHPKKKSYASVHNIRKWHSIKL